MSPEQRRLYDAYYRSCAENYAKLREQKKRYKESEKGKARIKSDISKIQAKRKTIEGRAVDMLRSARNRRYECSLTLEWVTQRVRAGTCELTGLPFDLNGGPFGPSIDRVDSAKGYTPDNCRVILWGLNRSLGIWGEDVFTQIAQAYLKAR